LKKVLSIASDYPQTSLELPLPGDTRGRRELTTLPLRAYPEKASLKPGIELLDQTRVFVQRRIWIWVGSFGLILATVGAIAGLAWWKQRSIWIASQAPPPPEMPVAVVLAPVESATYRQQTIVIGTVMAPRWITVSNEIPGTVREVAFQPGGTVDANQLLVRLDSGVEQAQLEASKARLKLAESTLARLQSIKGLDAISKLELDEAVARRDEAIANVAELSAMIDRRTIRAPFRAKAGLSDTHVGQYLPAGTKITSLQSLDGYLLVDFMLPQGVADVLQVGDVVRLTGTGFQLEAKIEAFEAMADRVTRNLATRARIENPPEQLQPGDSLRIAIDFGPELTSAAVPVQALRRSPSGAFVYIVESDDKGQLRARTRPVQPGPTFGSLVRIFSGLSSEDRVVADGSFKIRDGALLRDSSTLPPETTQAGN
jgi:membrane fusion protein, multidrug efflux system